MTTTKSYLAGLGMTGIVIGSVLVLLAVGTGLVAFDGARDVGGGRAPLDRVVVGKDAQSVGGERTRRRPDAPPLPATAARPPVAAPPLASAPGTTSGPDVARERGSSTRAGHGHGHGGARVRTRDSLGGGVPVRDASEDGGGAAADGPPGRTKRGAGAPTGHAGNPAPDKPPGHANERAAGKVPGPLQESGIGHGRGLGIGAGKGRVRQAVDGGVPSGLLP